MAASGKAQANGRRAIFITGAASGIGVHRDAVRAGRLVRGPGQARQIGLLNRFLPELVRKRLRRQVEAL
jgi:hypothetical protein